MGILNPYYRRLYSTSYSTFPDDCELEDNLSTAESKDSMSKDAEVYYGRPVMPSNQIFLLTTPVSTLKALGIKNPIDIVAHWTICINGWCYELARQASKKFPYTYKAKPEQDWRAYRASQGKPIESHLIGYMAMPYSHEYINEVGKCIPSCRVTRNPIRFPAN